MVGVNCLTPSMGNYALQEGDKMRTEKLEKRILRIEKSMEENLKNNKIFYNEFEYRLSGGLGINDTSDEVTATIMILSNTDFVDGELPEDEESDFHFMWYEPTEFMKKFVGKIAYELAGAALETDEKLFWGDIAVERGAL